MNRQILAAALGGGVLLMILAVAPWTPPVHAAQAPDHVGQYTQADIEFGLRLYSSTCTTCHGENGDRVVGVNLRSGQFSRAESDTQLTMLIRMGIPGTAMPPGEYSQSELAGLVAYLRTMGELDLSDVTLGDAGRGEAVYQGRDDCASCHRIRGNGSRLGPDLTNIGAARTAGALESSLLDPSSSMIPINRPVRVVTADGTVVTGRRLNEDTYTVQLMDQNERLRSLEKATLREFSVLMESSMPSYEDSLSEQEVADLLAYLLTLRGIED